ncbi:unnamed protein product [Clonostachys rosea f. rosea IK726]|uniref:Uncharacterized protein n=2 Tax=Bionectria ochroleuca TaxID=29856 RepID=A0A0B7JUD6_BIOOC|nr:unnamed protein product [Clonostachys rosea f. rosea IK726]
MSADTTPISPARFAAALKDLSISMLHLKSLEIRNSIAHLQYSNDQLRPFAEGSATALSTTQNGEPQSSPWTDGTFQTGTIHNGQVTFDSQPNGRPAQGGSLTDEQLRAALEERLGDIANEDEDESGGLHL